MQPIRAACLLAAPFLFVCSSVAACDLPALASVPEKTDDTASVMRDVRRYSDSIAEYTACLREELEDAGGDEAPPLVRSILVTRNNHAVDEHKAVTELYAKRVGPLANLRLAHYLDGDSRDCLFGDSVVGTGVLSDAAVVFFLRGAQAFLNLLPATCPELERNGSFLVGNTATGTVVSPGARGVINPGFGGARGIDTPLSNRVCDQNDIFPYRDGAAARRVFSCPLGRFYAIPEDEARQLLGAPRPAANAD